MLKALTVLGAGTVTPLPDYGCAGYILHWGSGEGERPILIDCGSGTLDRLSEQGTAVEEIELMLISHFHVDHVSDLAAILLSRWIRNLPRGREAHRMTIVGPKGLGTYVAAIAQLNQPWFSDYRFELIELEAGGYTAPAGSPFDGLELRTELTGHTENSICYRISDREGRCLFYSGDTDYNEALLPLAREADLGIVECSMPDDKKLDGHLTPRLAGRLAERARIRRVVLTHFYEEVLSIDIEHEVAREYHGHVELASKLRRFSIG